MPPRREMGSPVGAEPLRRCHSFGESREAGGSSSLWNAKQASRPLSAVKRACASFPALAG